MKTSPDAGAETGIFKNYLITRAKPFQSFLQNFDERILK
jgi:hypothetical protein